MILTEDHSALEHLTQVWVVDNHHESLLVDEEDLIYHIEQMRYNFSLLFKASTNSLEELFVFIFVIIVILHALSLFGLIAKSHHLLTLLFKLCQLDLLLNTLVGFPTNLLLLYTIFAYCINKLDNFEDAAMKIFFCLAFEEALNHGL